MTIKGSYLEFDNERFSVGVGFIISSLIFDPPEEGRKHILIMFGLEDEDKEIIGGEEYEGNEWWNDLIEICKNEGFIIASSQDVINISEGYTQPLSEPQICLLYPATLDESQEEVDNLHERIKRVSKYCKNGSDIFLFMYREDEVIVDTSGKLKAYIRFRDDQEIIEDREEFGF